MKNFLLQFHMVAIVLIGSLIANGYMFKQLNKPVASHVSYYCANLKKHSIITRTARIFPAIKDMSEIDNLERQLEAETSCPIVSISGWRDVACHDCGKDKELAAKDVEINKLARALEAKGKGGK